MAKSRSKGIDFSAQEEDALRNLEDSALDFSDLPPTRAVIVEDDLPKDFVRTSFRLNRGLHREMREWSIRHEISLHRILVEGFDLMKARHGV